MNEQVKQSVEKIAGEMIGQAIEGLVKVEPGMSSTEHMMVWAVEVVMIGVLYVNETSTVVNLPEAAVAALCVMLPMPVMVYTVCRTWLKARGVRAPEVRQEGPDAVRVCVMVGVAGGAGPGTGA